MAYPAPPTGSTPLNGSGAPAQTPPPRSTPIPDPPAGSQPLAGPAPPAGSQPIAQDRPDVQPKQANSGLYSVNPGVNVIGDYLTRWTKFAAGGIRDGFRAVVDGLANQFHLGIYDFNKGHHFAPNDPHLDGRAMDVDTINGESVGTKLTPTIRSYIDTALQNPNVRVGVPSQIYQALPADLRKRAFVDAPAHIHTELAAVMPGQSVAPRGFTAEPAKGFVKDPAPPAASQPLAPPAASTPLNPMDAPDGATGPVGGTIAPMAHSALMQVAGQADLMFILSNAQLRDTDPKTGQAPSIIDGMQNPQSHVYQAWQLYQHDPAQAMDEYGVGSPAQEQYMAKNYPGTGEGRFADTLQKLPFLNALYTFGVESVNPMAAAEGGIAGKAMGLAGGALRGTAAEQAGARAASGIGLGSPLYDLNRVGGAEASQWAKGAISSINAPHVLLHLPSNKEILKDAFGGLTPEAQAEVVRLKQGLKPNPTFAADHPDLERRAKLLIDDMEQVEAHQKRVGILPPERTFNPKKFFPMANSQDFGPQAELEAELRGQGAPGAGGPTAYHKVNKDLDESIASGTLDKDFLPANNYDTWRRQRLQRVAFEDAIARAPSSVRRDIQAEDFKSTLGVPLSQPWQRNINTSVADTLKQWVGENNARFAPGHPERYDLADNPKWVSALNLMGGAKSPVLARSMVAPELWNFVRGNNGLQKFVSTTGTYLPGQEQTFVGKYVAVMRNAIISNFLFHPAVNIAGNDAVARGIYNLGGPQWEVGGYAYNAAKSLATQFGLKSPESWVGSAEQYSHWLDRAMKAGGVAEFGEPRAAALGGDYARTLTVPSKRWIDRMDKALTAVGDFNRERTFSQKGEQVFAVSLFKDAIEKGGMTDPKAGQVVREALGDYYNFDPKSPWSTFFFFMPWLKGNMKFWVSTLMKRPQYVTTPAHALRNFGLEESPESYQGPYPTDDFTTYLKGGTPWTVPFPGRDIGHLAQAVAAAASGDVLGAAEPVEQMLAGRATPPVRLASDTITTITNAFSGDVKGPETDWNMIVNPRAPVDEQRHQAASYFASHFIPVPLFAYAVQDAARKGLSPQDLGQALITASGGGYFGQQKMDDYSKRMLKKAQSTYKKAYDNYRYKDFGDAYLKSAWDTYTDSLRGLGVIQ